VWTCRFCLAEKENLCLDPHLHGWDIDGGYATYVVVREDYIYRCPRDSTDAAVAPLLCAGIIGFRALRRTELPKGGRLGIYGFGGSAHLTAQIAIAEGARVHVMTRSPESRELALALGAASVGDTDDAPPGSLDGAILFASWGEIVPTALRALDRGGILAVAVSISLTFPPLNYEHHSSRANAAQRHREHTTRRRRIPRNRCEDWHSLDRASITPSTRRTTALSGPRS